MMPAVGAIAAWKGCDGGTSVDYGSLTLGGITYPDINVVCSVALVECTYLLLSG